MSQNKPSWKPWHNVVWGLFLIGTPISAWYLSNSPIAGQPVEIWWLFMAGLTLILFVTGHGIAGSWKGALLHLILHGQEMVCRHD
jgi:hypothetical protein